MTEDPIVETDYYLSKDKGNAFSKMKGDRIMRFGNFKTEQQRIKVDFSNCRKQRTIMP